MREIVLDTETTGLDPAAGHRVVEIACVELENHVQTGRVHHFYLNPERDMPEDAFRIHGLSLEFLSQHKTFADEAEAFLKFIEGAALVIHNAEFDLKFLDHELKRAGHPPIAREHGIVDTVSMARRKFPGSPASLDALCRRFEIDLSARTKHGARLDCELLALVYLELIGGREPGLDLAASARRRAQGAGMAAVVRPPRPHAPSEAELAAHAEFLKKIKEPVWLS
jgi:DNA polymerase III subunit epsilon